MQPLDAHINGVRWEGEFDGHHARDAGSSRSRPGTTCSPPGGTRCSARSTPASTTSAGELSEGVVLLEQTLAATKDAADRETLETAIATLRDTELPEAVLHETALSPEVGAAVERAGERHGAESMAKPLPLEVDRVRARFSTWYELFPRSWGGLKAVEEQIPAIAELGFDVLYFPPIHPIGRKNRKGRNNTLVAGPDDPGVPYAIGAAEGGHDAVHPELGTLDDMRALCATAREHGMDVCLDIALNASADHPWLTEHPEWFQQRPDGTIKYAENPPKKYQDIYNFNWDTPAWKELWEEWRRILLFWVDAGVKVFRVDNPHTKPFPFWEWVIKEVHAVDRDVIFLAEAFTRRAVMRELAKLGFTQSYTYFTWKNSRHELTEYVNELAWTEEAEYFRPNFFPVTPDILHAYLQHGGPPAFVARLVLAATLSPSYGIYSGYEHFENVPVREGSEEYMNSEKYEIRERALDGPLLPMIRRINEIRQENPALQILSERLLARDPQRRADGVRQAGAGQLPHHRRQPRPAPRPGGRRPDPRPARAARPSSRSTTCSPATTTTGASAPTTSGSTPAPTRPTSSASSREPQRPRTLVRGRAAVVQDGRLLRDPHARVLRRQRRRLR